MSENKSKPEIGVEEKRKRRKSYKDIKVKEFSQYYQYKKVNTKGHIPIVNSTDGYKDLVKKIDDLRAMVFELRKEVDRLDKVANRQRQFRKYNYEQSASKAQALTGFQKRKRKVKELRKTITQIKREAKVKAALSVVETKIALTGQFAMLIMPMLDKIGVRPRHGAFILWASANELFDVRTYRKAMRLPDTDESFSTYIKWAIKRKFAELVVQKMHLKRYSLTYEGKQFAKGMTEFLKKKTVVRTIKKKDAD